MKLLLTTLLVFALLTGLSYAEGVFAGGFSFTGLAKNPGITLMSGVQFDIDSEGDIKGRVLYEKVNWGDTVNIDNIALMFIKYWPAPFWQNDGLDCKLGLHFTGDYATDDADFGAAIGCELYKQVVKEGFNLGIFAAGDILYKVDTPDAYFMLSVGGVFKF